MFKIYLYNKYMKRISEYYLRIFTMSDLRKTQWVENEQENLIDQQENISRISKM